MGRVRLSAAHLTIVGAVIGVASLVAGVVMELGVGFGLIAFGLVLTGVCMILESGP